MKLLNEFIFEQEHVKGPHGIFEMTQISSQGELPKNSSVWVYGENDEQGTKPPHFHVKIDNGRFEFEIKLNLMTFIILIFGEVKRLNMIGKIIQMLKKK